MEFLDSIAFFSKVRFANVLCLFVGTVYADLGMVVGDCILLVAINAMYGLLVTDVWVEDYLRVGVLNLLHLALLQHLPLP